MGTQPAATKTLRPPHLILSRKGTSVPFQHSPFKFSNVESPSRPVRGSAARPAPSGREGAAPSVEAGHVRDREVFLFQLEHRAVVSGPLAAAT